MNITYWIHCCAGTGGLFLTSVVAQILGYDAKSNFSTTGHAHNMGQGNWRGASGVCFIGNHWDINYRPGVKLYYTHELPDKFAKEPGHKLILITADPKDYRKVTELYVKKAWPDIWTKEEYDKWVSPNYPPYSLNNIKDSELIVNDLVTNFEQTVIADWHQRNLILDADYSIDFRTIMGLDDRDLVDDICAMIHGRATDATRNYVKEYQQLNFELYFKNYV